LKEKEENIEPAFDINQVKVPVGFRPTKQVLEVKEKTVKEKDFRSEIIEELIKKTNLDEKTIIGKIKQIEQEKNITFEVASLLFGKEYDIALEKFYEEIKGNIEE